MMGRNHTRTTIGLFALGAGLAGVGLVPLVSLFAAGAATAGGATGPDIDHPGAGPAKTFGPVSGVLAQVVHRVAGGHRGATHTFRCAAALGALLYGACLLWPRWTPAAVVTISVGWALRALIPPGPHAHRDLGAPALGLAAGVTTYWFAPTALVAPAFAFGWACHIVEDRVQSRISRAGHGRELTSIGGGIERAISFTALFAGGLAIWLRTR